MKFSKGDRVVFTGYMISKGASVRRGDAGTVVAVHKDQLPFPMKPSIRVSYEHNIRLDRTGKVISGVSISFMGRRILKKE